MRSWIVIVVVYLVMTSGGLIFSYIDESPKNDAPEIPAKYQLVDNPATLSGSNRPLLNYYWTYTYTHSDMTIFAYVNNTYVVVKTPSGKIIWNGTLNKSEHKNLFQYQLGSPGVYEVNATMPYSILVGDHLSLYVMGYMALDYWGRGTSTQFYTYQVEWKQTQTDPHFVVFSCENNNYVEVRDTTKNALLWKGTLNRGGWYDNTDSKNQYLTVTSTKPVTALSYTDQGYYVPACDTQRFTGKRFYTFAGHAYNWIHGANIVAYENNTNVTLKNIKTGQVIWQGVLNAGEFYSSNVSNTFLVLESNKNVTFAIQPYGPFKWGYYHSLYVYDGASGTGIGKLFYHPATSNPPDVHFIVFSYEKSLVKIYDPNGTMVWNGNLNRGGYHFYKVQKGGLYKIESTGNISVLLDSGDKAGADFAPVFYTLNPIPILVTQTLNPKVISSGGQSGVSVHVSDVVTSIWDADVKWNTTCGMMTPASAKSDVSGNTISSFNAPPSNSRRVCWINATASKRGYLPGWDADQITINGPEPLTLYTYAFANPGIVNSQGKSQIRVMVTDGLKPVSNVQVNLSVSAGSASPKSGLTNANGEFFSTFTAPQTWADQIVVVIGADAVKAGFLQGRGETQVTVLPAGVPSPVLDLQIMPTPRQVLAQRTARITVKVTNGTNPVPDAHVYLNVTNGSLTPKSGVTNANGEVQSVFTAPNVSRLTQIMIIASGEKSGYIPGSGQDVISVLPPDITVKLTANPNIIYIKDRADVYLEASNPLTGGLDNASLSFSLTPNLGMITPSSGVTDAKGRFHAVYIPPSNLTSEQTVIIQAKVSKPMFNTGYGEIDIKIVMYPVLYVRITPEKNMVKSGEKITLRVTVQNAKNGTPIPNATVNLTTSGGSIQPNQGLTNGTGVFESVFTAPRTSIITGINITAEASTRSHTGSNATIVITVEPLPVPVIRVSTPNGGENWTVNTCQEIRWNLSGGTGYLFSNVSYSVDGASGPWISIATNLSIGVYMWYVPVIKTTFNAYIKVEVYDSAGVSAFDISDDRFTIFNPADYERMLDRMEVTPSNITVNLKTSVQFTAKGYDKYGVEIPNLKITWRLSNPRLGTITSTGLYTSGIVETEGNVSATASSGGVTKTGYAHVKISKNTKILSNVTILPEVKEVPVNSTIDLFATAYDTHGQPIMDASFTWNITSNCASISPTTGNKTTLRALQKGYAVITVRAIYNGLEKNASLNISLVEEVNDNDHHKDNGIKIDLYLLFLICGVILVTVSAIAIIYSISKRRKRKHNPSPFASPPGYPESPQNWQDENP